MNPSAVAVGAPYRPSQRSLSADAIALACAVAGAAALAFPIVPFGVACFLLINLPPDTPRAVRLGLAITAAISLAMMTGARALDPAAPNDIDAYYDVYLDVAAGRLEALGRFGGGLEFALPLLTWLWSVALPPLTPNGLMFCAALTGGLLFVVWVEKAFYAERGWHDPALMGLCILMLNLYFSTQLVRQFLALVVLLYAFTARSRRAQAAWVLLASSFHLTAIAFFAVWLLARRGWRGWVAIVGLAVVVRLYFWDIAAALDIVPAALADKLAYYLDNTQDFTEADIASMRGIVLLGGVSLLALAMSGLRPPRPIRPWLVVPWLAALVHLLLLPIPLASLRTTLIVHSILPGLVAHRMFARRARGAFLFVANALFVYKMFGHATADASGNLLSVVAMLDRFFADGPR